MVLSNPSGGGSKSGGFDLGRVLLLLTTFSWLPVSELVSSVEVVGRDEFEASSEPEETSGPTTSFKFKFKKLPLVKTLCL